MGSACCLLLQWSAFGRGCDAMAVPSLLLLLLLHDALAALASTTSFPPNFRDGSDVHLTRLRRDLLLGYDPVVPPRSNRVATGTSYSATPLETSRKDLLTGGKEGSPKVRKAHTQQLNEASLKRGMRAAEQELKDELPLDAFGITNGASVKLRVERKPPRLASPRPARPPAAPVTAASSHSSRQQLQKDAENDESPPAPNGETQFFV